MLTAVLFFLNLALLLAAVFFTTESLREKEPRAPKFGIVGILFHLALAVLILTVPPSRPFLAMFFGILTFLFLIPLDFPSPPREGTSA
jgi:hypothetical protein